MKEAPCQGATPCPRKQTADPAGPKRARGHRLAMRSPARSEVSAGVYTCYASGVSGLLRALLSAALTVASLACSKPAQDPPPGTVSELPPVPEAKAEAEAPEEQPPAEEVAEAVIELDAPDSGTKLPNTPVAPTALTVTWREGAGFEQELELLYLASGVLARSGGQLYELDKSGELVARPELELPEGELLGEWPKDAWVARVTPVETTPSAEQVEVELLRYKRGKWKTQKIGRKTSWRATEPELRKGWHGGFLLREGSELTRVGTSHPKPRVGPRMGKALAAVIETRSNRIYSISSRPNALYAQRNCENFDCVEQHAVKLPYGKRWTFSIQVPRQRHSVTMLATVETASAVGYHLLHYEIGGWKLESLVHPPEGMWPDGEGGLWVLVDDALWYRDPGGEWFDVAPPEGASSISAAIAKKPAELWIAAELEGKPRVFATAARVEHEE